MLITYERNDPVPSIPDLSIEVPVEMVSRSEDSVFHSSKLKSPLVLSNTTASHHVLTVRTRDYFSDTSRACSPLDPIPGTSSRQVEIQDPLRWIEESKCDMSDADDCETASFDLSPTLRSVLNLCASRPHSISDI